MVHIISKSSGPRSEDVRARSLIERNRGTIERLADQLSNGAYSASRRAVAPAPPQASGSLIGYDGVGRAVDEPRPFVWIRPNHRVLVVDLNTSRQMHYLGEVKRIEGVWRFVLATAANGYALALDADLAGRLAPLDGVAMGAGRTDAVLTAELSRLLGYDASAPETAAQDAAQDDQATQ